MFVGKADYAGSASITASIPSGVQDGDVLIAVSSQEDNATGLAAPAGWVAQTQIDDGTSSTLRVWYYVWNTGDPTSGQWTIATADDVFALTILAYRGIDNTTPIAAHSGVRHDGGTTFTTPAASPSNQWVIACFAARGYQIGLTPITFTMGSGLTERSDHGINDGGSTFVSLGVADTNGAVTGTNLTYTATASLDTPYGVPAVIVLTAGAAPPAEGSATGSWSVSGSSTGQRNSAGSATGTWSAAGSATGEAPAGGGPSDIAIRSSTESADADQLTTNISTNVPAGVQAGDIVILTAGLWESATPTRTWPAGFTEIAYQANGNQKVAAAWKRLTGADTGTYTLGLSAQQWAILHAVAISGAVASGSPIEDFAVASGTGTSASLSVDTTSQPALVVAVGHDQTGAVTGGTNFTVQQDSSFAGTATRIPGSTGTFTASGVAWPSSAYAAVLIAVAGADAAPPEGAATGTWTVSGSASGSMPALEGGYAVGTWSVTGSASGVGDYSGSATGAWLVTGTATAPFSHPYVTAASANGRYLVDQSGNPIINFFDTLWNMVQLAGRDSAGDWQADMDHWIDTRSAQGFTGLKFTLFAQVINGGPADLLTFDDVSPFDTTSPTTADITAFNETYWSRVDYLIDQAAAAGMTCWVHIMYKDDVSAPSGTGWLQGHTSTDYTNFGTALANRYKDKPNIVWVYGGDYFDDSAASMELIADAMVAAGDTHLVTVQNYSDSANGTYWTTSRMESGGGQTVLGNAIATVDGLYIYQNLHEGAEVAWNDIPTLPVIYYDGEYDDLNAAGATKLRRDWGWALTSGAWSSHYGSEANWAMGAGWRNSLTDTLGVQHVTAMTAAFTALPGWEELVPDWGTVLITSSRGTGTAYVTGAQTADGRMAVVYTPNAATAVTLATGTMAAGWTARWIDPTNGAEYAAGTGPSFSRSTANAAGGSDYLLVLEVEPVPVPTGLTATVVSATQIDLNWDDMPGASGYDIERDGSVIVTNHAVSNYSDTGLSPNTTYTYRVRTVD